MSSPFTTAIVIDLNAIVNKTSKRRTAKSSHGRRTTRVVWQQRVFVQVIACGNPSKVGTAFFTKTLDAGPEGIRIQMNTSLPIGTLVDVWVDRPDGAGKLFLSGRLSWQHRVGGRMHGGIRFDSDPCYDYDEWCALCQNDTLLAAVP